MKKLASLVLSLVPVLAASSVVLHASDDAVPAMPAVGQAAPAFTLPSQDGTPVSLKNFRGHWVVVYFYPKDMTTGCTIEAHKFQESLPQFTAKHAVILGISVDSKESHQQFCTKDSLTFRLLADTEHNVTSAYGSLGGHNGMAMANRNTFLVSPKGKIVKVWTKVNPAESASEVLAVLPDKGSEIKQGQ